MKNLKIKGIKKAASEAKDIPAGYHMQAVYNLYNKTLEVLPELLSQNWYYTDDVLDKGEVLISIFPGYTMKDIQESIYFVEEETCWGY